MSLLTVLIIILVLVVISFIIYLIEKYLPIDPLIKRIISFILILFAIIYLLKATGLLSWLGSVRI